MKRGPRGRACEAIRFGNGGSRFCALHSVRTQRGQVLFDLLQERMLIFQVFIERLDLCLNMGQFSRRLIQTSFMVVLARHKFPAGIFQRLGHGGDTPIDLIKVVRGDFVIGVNFPGQRIVTSRNHPARGSRPNA